MNSRRRQRLYVTLGLLLGLSVTTVLVMYALRTSVDLFYTPGEILYGRQATHLKPMPGQRIRVGGMVMPGSVQRDPHSLMIWFKLYDDRGVVQIGYEGILPDLFREGQGVVVQGILRSSDVVQANEVLAKHDENYTPPEIKHAVRETRSAFSASSPNRADKPL